MDIYFAVAILSVCIIMSLSYRSKDTYKDLLQGKKEVQTESFDYAVEEVFIDDPEFQKLFIYDGNSMYSVKINKDTYYNIINNDPYDDEKERIYSTYMPHIHPIKVTFYENTGILCGLEILE